MEEETVRMLDDGKLRFWVTGFVMSIGFAIASGFLAFSAAVFGSPIMEYFLKLAGVMVASVAISTFMATRRWKVLKSEIQLD